MYIPGFFTGSVNALDAVTSSALSFASFPSKALLNILERVREYYKDANEIYNSDRCFFFLSLFARHTRQNDIQIHDIMTKNFAITSE